MNLSRRAQAMRLLGAGGPAVSSANVATPGTTPELSAAELRHPDPTPEQTRALQWLVLHSTDRPVRCPMEQPAAPPPLPVIHDPIPIPVPVVTKGPDPLTALTVTAIMARDNGNLARINGKVYAAGTSPLTGWNITRIDSDNGLVELTGTEGKSVELHLKRPDPVR
jgi:hypothetical protein